MFKDKLTDTVNINWNLAAQRVVVVGGCGGIGQALVKTCLDQQLRVAVLDLPRSIAENPVDECVELVLEIDALVEETIITAFQAIEKRWGAIEHLVCLQGFTGAITPLENLEMDTWNDVMDVNLRSVWLCCKQGLPLLKQGQRGGSIVTVSSGIANLGAAGYGPYAISKSGVQTLTKIVAREAAPHIRVNCVAPGAVITPFLGKGTGRGGQQGDAPERVNLEQYLKMVPAGYVAQPAEVVEPILFLMSNAARYITGQVLHVNGGALML